MLSLKHAFIISSFWCVSLADKLPFSFGYSCWWNGLTLQLEIDLLKVTHSFNFFFLGLVWFFLNFSLVIMLHQNAPLHI